MCLYDVSTFYVCLQVRQRVVSRLEVWLQNPKWSRPAQELLVSLCSNLTSHTQFDVDVISQLVKFRIKAKPIVNLYLSCMRSVVRRAAAAADTVDVCGRLYLPQWTTIPFELSYQIGNILLNMHIVFMLICSSCFPWRHPLALCLGTGRR